MNSMSASRAMVSVHSGASTPRIALAGTPGRRVAGSQSYAVRTSIRPAQLCPSGVALVYFMSR
jgi:hypothetical protein